MAENRHQDREASPAFGLGDLRGRAIWVVLGGFVCQLALGYGYIFGPLLKDITADLGASRGEFALGRAPMLIVQALMSPVVGYLTIRYGPRAVLTGSVLLFGMTWCAMSGITSITQLYAINLLIGASLAGLGDITVGAVITQWIRRGRGLALGIAYTGSNLAGAVLSPLVVYLSALGSWRSAVFAIGVGGIVVLLPFAAFFVRSPRAGEGADDLPSEEASESESRVHMTLREAMATRSFWILGFSLLVFFAYFVSMIEHLVPFLTDEGVTPLRAASYFSLAIGIGMISKVAFGLLADRLPHKTTLIVDFALLAISSWLLLALPNETLIYPFLILYGLAAAARDVVYPLILTHCFGARYMPQIYGVLMLTLPAGAVGTYYAATTFDATGSYTPALQTFAVLNGLALASLFAIRRESPLRSPQPAH